jgi:hypothetical protein
MSTAKHVGLLIGLALVLSLVLPRFAPRIGLAEAACTESDFDPAALRGDQAEGDWLVYHNARLGLSFRYPRAMQVDERDPVKFGYDKAMMPDAIVDLRVQDSTVMRFICARGEQTPEIAAMKFRAWRNTGEAEGEPSLRSIEIDGHEALQAVVGGVDGKGAGASCGWRVTILQPRGCSIFPLGSSDDAFPPLHDGHFPLLSIIETVRFAQ